MIIEEYDPESEEPREISPRDKLINWLLFIIVIAILGYLAYASRQIEKIPREIECFPEPIYRRQFEGQGGIPLIYDIRLSTDKDTYHQGDLIRVNATNIGRTEVWFPKGLNLIVYERVTDFTSVSRVNLVEDKNDFEKILYPIEIDPVGIFLYAKPVLLADNESKEIYISIWGYRFENNLYCAERHEGGISLTILP